MLEFHWEFKSPKSSSPEQGGEVLRELQRGFLEGQLGVNKPPDMVRQLTIRESVNTGQMEVKQL
jgi:hypothetical protein